MDLPEENGNHPTSGAEIGSGTGHPQNKNVKDVAAAATQVKFCWGCQVIGMDPMQWTLEVIVWED